MGQNPSVISNPRAAIARGQGPRDRPAVRRPRQPRTLVIQDQEYWGLVMGESNRADLALGGRFDHGSARGR